MRPASRNSVEMNFSPVPTDLRNKFASLRAGSEPSDFFNDKTGLRKSPFPIKVAGICMGSQENINSADEGEGEFLEQWRRRSRRNSLTLNSPTSTADRKSYPAMPPTPMKNGSGAPFGPSTLPNGKSRRSSSMLGRWGQRRNVMSYSSSNNTDDEGTDDKSDTDKNMSEIKSFLSEMQAEISAIGASARKLVESADEEAVQVSKIERQKSQPPISNRSYTAFNSISNKMESSERQETIESITKSCNESKEIFNSESMLTSEQKSSVSQSTQSTKEANLHQQSKTISLEKHHNQSESQHLQNKSESSVQKLTSSQRRMSNYRIESTVEIEEHHKSFDQKEIYIPCKTPDDLPRLADMQQKPFEHHSNGYLDEMETTCSVSVEGTVVIKAPPISFSKKQSGSSHEETTTNSYVNFNSDLYSTDDIQSDFIPKTNNVQKLSYPSRPSSFIKENLRGSKSFQHEYQSATKVFNSEVKTAGTAIIKSSTLNSSNEAKLSTTTKTSSASTIPTGLPISKTTTNNTSVNNNERIEVLNKTTTQLDSKTHQLSNVKEKSESSSGCLPESKADDLRPFSQLSITSDVMMVDDDEVIYHEPNDAPPVRKVADLVTENPDQVNFHSRTSDKLSGLASIQSQYLDNFTLNYTETINQLQSKFESKKDLCNTAGQSKDLVLTTAESAALEKLFDKLIDGDMTNSPKRSNTESSIASTVSLLENDDGVQGDASSDEDCLKSSGQSNSSPSKWEYRQLGVNSKDDTNLNEKTRRKRRRNRTVDHHELPSDEKQTDLWCAQIAGYTQRAFGETQTNPDAQIKRSSTCESDDGLGHGLGLIIDKLKNIETKLDELKTLDQTVWYPEMPDSCLSESTTLDDFLNPQKLNGNSTGNLPLDNTQETTDNFANLSPSSAAPKTKTKAATKISLKKIENCDDDCDSDDKTLVDEIEDEERCNSAITFNDENFELPEDSIIDSKNIVVCSPISPCSPSPDSMKKCLTWPQRGHTRISSISSISEDDIGQMKSLIDDDDDEDLSIGRESRIEELARKMMSKVEKERSSSDSKTRIRHPSEPTPRHVNLELDTVSERSELDDDDNGDLKEEGDVNLKRKPPTASSHRPFRTRSASRERALPKIRYCWRCHQTGHESFDCTAELNPDFWCPRCLEATHWEDNCWVNEKEVFCNICSLPGHLPCVHETKDFRQRKLVVETFGWLAFKDWFREPDFWSWWNCAGFTNVPLYKLMQHRPRVTSPEMQQM